jgi:RNA polymerase sigma factor (sigma-70 family)
MEYAVSVDGGGRGVLKLRTGRGLRPEYLAQLAAEVARYDKERPDDAALVFGKVARALRPLLVHYARAFGAEPGDEDRIVDEALDAAEVRMRRGDYDPTRGQVSSWLIGFVRNCSRKFYSNRCRTEQFPAFSDDVFAAPSTEPEVENRKQAALLVLTGRALSLMKEKDNVVIRLRCHEELDFKAIARALNLSSAAVARQRYRRAVTKCRELVDKLQKEQSGEPAGAE